LRNKGTDTYKNDIFGDSINIERTITQGGKSGTTSYKIKDSKGNIVSSKASDLKLILDKFNIQVDNPCAIMTQDISRKFLSSSKGEKKFEFFERATQLSVMIEEFNYVKENKGKIEKMLKIKNEALEEKRVELEKKKKEYEDITKLKTLEKEISKARTEYAWSLVIKEEGSLKKFLERKKEIEKEKEDLNNIWSNYSEELSTINEQDRVYELEAEKISRKIQTISGQKTNQNNLIKVVEKKIAKAKQEIETAHSNIQTSEKRKKSAEYKIETEKKNIENKKMKIKTMDNKDEEKISEYNEQLSKLKDEIEKLGLEKSELESTLDKIEEEMRESSNQNDGKRKDSLYHQIDRLKNVKQDKYKFFENRSGTFSKFLQELSKSKKFKRPPIGPIGLLINLSDTKWGAVAEIKLKNYLQLYILDNFEDDNEFKKLCFANKLDLSTIIFSYDKNFYDLRKKIQEQYLTLFKVIEIDKNVISKYPIKYDDEYLLPTILNLLVDQANIETCALVKDNKEGVDVMFKKSIKGIKEVYSMTGTRFFKRGESENTVVKNNKARLFLQTENIDEQIE
jgi:structural maintenance of chromosomes protein 6